MTGRVLAFEKSYGWIAPDEGGRDCFVHFSQILDHGFKTLNENDVVIFDIEQAPKGPRALNVRVLEQAVRQ